MQKFIDLTGQRFGSLTVIKRDKDYVSPKGKKAPQWLCKCDCGNNTVIRESSLKTKTSKTCGCVKPRKGHKKYGRLYKIWKQMRQRCFNVNHPAYNNYGGRGIRICNDWNDFMSFCKWANENGYRDGLSIDRINNDGNYEPSNCRFSDRTEQARNRRTTKRILYDGKYRSYAEIENIKGLPKGFISHRVRRGFSIDDAINLPKFINGDRRLGRKFYDEGQKE